MTDLADLNWKNAIKALAKVMPQLAFQPQLVAAIEKAASETKPPAILMAQVEVILAVCKQNERVAELHGYAGLTVHAKKVLDATRTVLDFLKKEGLTPTRPTQQSASI